MMDQKRAADGIVPVQRDAFGHQLLDYWRGDHGLLEVIERDDGYISISGPVRGYFAPPEDWHPGDRAALMCVRGRVLDVGSGAGRHDLYLQEQGFDVTALDNSPLALDVCRARGVVHTLLKPVTLLSPDDGPFDTVLMMGGNYGLMGGWTRGRWLLRRLHRLTTAEGRLIVCSRDPYGTDSPLHLAYHARNRARGRMSGQVRIRVRYLSHVGPWFDYLLASRAEMEAMLAGTGWHVSSYLGDGEPGYLAVIDKG